MAKVFRPWDVEQSWLLPPSVLELVPRSHPAHFVRELVRGPLDLSAILSQYSEERGYPPFHPAMMTALLLYGYSQGVFSSRKLAKGCEERLDFMAVTAMQKPDHRTIARFRQRHLAALGDLFVQILKLCQRAGLVRLGHVALDGTKVKANASKHKAMSYKRMREVEAKLKAEVADWFRRADVEDTSDDAEHGDRRGDELPEWVADKMARIERIAEAKAALEAEAREEAERRKGNDGDDDAAPPPSRPKHNADGTPGDKSQRNFTDPESRILKTRNGYLQGYNAQAAVDSKHQVIVATEVYAAQNDAPFLDEMLRQIKTNTGRQTTELSADTGYLSEANLEHCARRHVRAYIATGRISHGDGTPRVSTKRSPQTPLVRAMAAKLRRAGRRSRYRLRKQIVEPVFGQIKAALGFGGFLLRGLRKVRLEWRLVAAAHNLRKLLAA